MIKFKRIAAITGIFIFLIPVTVWALWIYAFNHANDQAQRVELFNSFIPSFLEGRFTLSFISLGCCAIAFVLSAINLNNSSIIIKTIAWLTLIASALMAFLNLFSLM